MKQKIYILGLLSTAVVFLGTIFKLNHWPGAGIMLTIGLASMVLLFFPVAITDSFRAEENRKSRILYIVTFITCTVVFTAMLFKIMHWPYAGFLLPFAIIFPYFVFLPVFILITSRNKNYNIYNMVAVLFLLALNSVFSALLALSASRERITDSLTLARNYNRVETVFEKMPSGGTGAADVLMKIDELQGVINEYQTAILNTDGITEDIWSNDPEKILRPDSRSAIMFSLDKSELREGKKLEKALADLLATIEKSPGYGDLSKALPAILDLGQPAPDDRLPIEPMFTGNYMAWTLIWLDAMETNLDLIKTTLEI